ncbi:hypothetical protein PPOLYM_03723 [Paenibacillus polymyxa]|nr:hypothetical protein PPOLYM_03723 [Paenibacillus polymyxa]
MMSIPGFKKQKKYNRGRDLRRPAVPALWVLVNQDNRAMMRALRPAETGRNNTVKL